jgi:nucleoside-diphosphate-sugar epimerase
MTTIKKGQALNIKDSRILIAGAASLVGSHTADLLLKEGAREVLLLDNFIVSENWLQCPAIEGVLGLLVDFVLEIYVHNTSVSLIKCLQKI